MGAGGMMTMAAGVRGAGYDVLDARRGRRRLLARLRGL